MSNVDTQLILAKIEMAFEVLVNTQEQLTARAQLQAKALEHTVLSLEKRLEITQSNILKTIAEIAAAQDMNQLSKLEDLSMALRKSIETLRA